MVSIFWAAGGMIEQKETPGERWEWTFIKSSGGILHRRSICQLQWTKSSACRRLFFMYSEFLKGSIRLKSSMNKLTSAKGSCHLLCARLCLFCDHVFIYLTVTVRWRCSSLAHVWTTFKSEGKSAALPGEEGWIFNILICASWKTLCKLFAELPAKNLPMQT